MRSIRIGKTVFSKAVLGMTAAAVIIFNTGVARAASLSDINQSSDYAKASIIALVDSNIISGDQNSNFHPHDTLTRSEMVKLIIKARGIDISTTPNVQTFKDVPKENWAYPYVEAAYKYGIIKGVSSDEFGANENCNREQMAAVFVRSMGLTDQDIQGKQDYYYVNGLSDKTKISGWAKDYVEFSMMSGLMNGKGNGVFGAKDYAEREQAAVLTHRFITGKDKIEKIVKGYLGTVDNYPELYNALVSNNQSFKGGIDMNMLMALKDLTGSNDPINMEMKMNGVVDGKDLDAAYTISMSAIGELPAMDQQFRVIVKDGKYYIKEPGNSKWSLIPDPGVEKIQTSNGKSAVEGVLRFYLNSDINKAGHVDLNGITATKYTISVNADTLNNLLGNSPLAMSSEQLVQFFDLLKNASGNIEYYLDSNNRIIKEKFIFTGNIMDKQDGQNASISISLDANLNESQSVEIKAPDPSEVDNSQEASGSINPIIPTE